MSSRRPIKITRLERLSSLGQPRSNAALASFAKLMLAEAQKEEQLFGCSSFIYL